MSGMRPIELTEDMFQGAISLEINDGTVKPWRLPFDRLKLFPPDDRLPAKAETPAGVRVRVSTNASRVGLTVVPLDELRRFDLVIDGALLQTVELEVGGDAVVFDALPQGTKTVELWLSPRKVVTLRRLLVEDGADLASAGDDRPRWITYGSSITHCGAAHSPARTWPAIVAREHNLHLTCLGYGGDCHVDSMVARMIRDLPADVISLKLGINVMEAASLSPRTFRPAIIAFVQIIRERHREIPIVVVSPIISPPHETAPNGVGLTLTLMREEIEDAVKRMIDAGDRNLHYFNGLDLFGKDLAAKYLPDGVHPNGDGYEILGQSFSKVVFRRIKL